VAARHRIYAACVLAWALGSCDRPPDPQPPAIVGVGGSPDPQTDPHTEPEPEPEPDPEPAVACEPPPPVEVADTWTASGPPPKRATEQICTALEERARRAIEPLSGPCETAADCELVRLACPFGCTRALAKGVDRRRARAAFDRYMDDCLPCKDKCPTLPARLVCVDGVCGVSNEAVEPDAACSG
jgi:hypothetical protein